MLKAGPPPEVVLPRAAASLPSPPVTSPPEGVIEVGNGPAVSTLKDRYKSGGAENGNATQHERVLQPMSIENGPRDRLTDGRDLA
jgi:hypothetical protein